MELTYVILVLLSICFVSLSLEEDAWINDFTSKTRGLTETTGSTSVSQNKMQENEAAKLENNINSFEGIEEIKQETEDVDPEMQTLPNYCVGIDNEITRLKNEKESIESKLNFYSDMKMKLLLNENEKLKSKVSQLELILNHFKQENEKVVSELEDKEATILILKEKCNSSEKTNQELKNSIHQIYNEHNFLQFLVERFKPKKEEIGESSENQINKRNSMEMLDEDEPESSVKKQKTQTELNTNFKSILKNQDLSNEKIMDQKQKPIRSTLAPKIRVAHKLNNVNIFIKNNEAIQVYVPCGSKESAKQAALDFGGKNYCNTPLEQVVKPEDKSYFFSFYTLGRDNQQVFVENDGIYYDYRFYYGFNRNGFKARHEKRCDIPDPYYHDKFVNLSKIKYRDTRREPPFKT